MGEVRALLPCLSLGQLAELERIREGEGGKAALSLLRDDFCIAFHLPSYQEKMHPFIGPVSIRKTCRPGLDQGAR